MPFGIVRTESRATMWRSIRALLKPESCGFHEETSHEAYRFVRSSAPRKAHAMLMSWTRDVEVLDLVVAQRDPAARLSRATGCSSI